MCNILSFLKADKLENRNSRNSNTKNMKTKWSKKLAPFQMKLCQILQEQSSDMARIQKRESHFNGHLLLDFKLNTCEFGRQKI